MSISSDKLKREIQAILKGADLESMSSKKVRLELEEKLGCDLLARKKEIDAIVLECINADDDEDEDGPSADDDGDSDYSAEEEVKSKKRASTGGRKSAAKKKRKHDSEDEDSEADDDSGSDYKPSGPAKGAKGKKKAKKGSDDDSDSDEDYKVPKKAAKKKAGGGGGGKGNGYTRPLKLSPELAELMGQEALPRHEVVKKMWEIIKGRNLYDPKNKQFAICDDDVFKVIGVKRFRTFGMLKYLKEHFIAE